MNNQHQDSPFYFLIALGLITSAVGYFAFELLNLIYIESESFKAATSIASIFFSGVLLFKQRRRVGNVTTILLATSILSAGLFLQTPFYWILAGNLTLIGIATFAYLSIVTSNRPNQKLRLGLFSISGCAVLLLLSLLIGEQVLLNTYNLFLTFWVFFLTFSLIVHLPSIQSSLKKYLETSSTRNYQALDNSPNSEVQLFDNHYRQAKAAIKTMRANHSA